MSTIIIILISQIRRLKLIKSPNQKLVDPEFQPKHSHFRETRFLLLGSPLRGDEGNIVKNSCEIVQGSGSEDDRVEKGEISAA